MGNYCCGKPSLHETLKKNSFSNSGARKASTKLDSKRKTGEASSKVLNKNTVISMIFLKKESESQALLIRTTFDDISISKFSDRTFPPSKDSMIPSDPDHYLFKKVPKKLIEEYLQYEWHRLSEIFENKEKTFLAQALTPEEIIQGSLGSCYFICAVAGILKNNIQQVKKLFVIKEENKKGIYAVQFMIQGLPQVVVVDDYIPCKQMQIKNKLVPAFSSSRHKEAAIIILEKAWAKINYKCYMKTWLGTPLEALGCLTEAPSIYEYHERYKKKKQGNLLWIKLCEATLRKWILCANTEEIEEKEGQGIGLPPFHANLILDVYEVQKDEEEGYKNFPTMLQHIVENKIEYERNNENCLLLLKMRNPTGDSSKFKGKFHEESSNWTEGLRRVVGNLEGTKPGTFFVTLKEFIKYFSWTFICKLEEHYNYRSASFAIEKGYKLIEYRVNKDKTVKKQGKDDEENPENSWNSDLLEDDIEESHQINKKIPLNQNASIVKQEMESKIKQDNLTIINKSNDNIISPISKSKNIEPGVINQISEKKSILKLVTNFEDPQNTIKEINEKLPEPKINKNQFRLNNIIGAMLKIEEKTKCFITLHQPDHRFNYETIKDYKVPLAFIIIANYNCANGAYKFIKSEFLNWEKLILDCYLPPGEYHIFAKSYWSMSKPREHRLVLSTYSDFPCEIYELKQEELSSDWIERILVDMVRNETHKNYFSKNEQTSYYSYIMPNYTLSTGFGIFYIENNSLKGQLIVHLNITKSEGIKILSGNHLSSFGFVIPPKTFKHLIYQITGLPWESDLKYEQEIWYEYPVHSLMKKFAPQNPEELPRQEIEQQLYLSEIKYDRGYLIMIVNNSGKDYKGKFSFSKLKTFEVDKFLDHKKVEIICKGKTHNYLNIKCNKQKVDPNFKLIYKSKFTLV